MSGRLFVHCGLPKCGSTSLQSYLGAEATLLRRMGFVYPELGRDANRIAHHNLAYEVLGLPHYSPQYGSTEDVLEYLGATSADVVLSSEGFCRAICNRRRFSAFERFHAAAAERRERITYVVMVRTAARFIESSYIQSLMAGTLEESLADYERRHTPWFAELFKGLRRWNEVCRGRIAIRDASRADAIDLFSDVLGLPRAGSTAPRKNVRASLKRAAFLYQRRFAGDGSPKHRTPQDFHRLCRAVHKLPTAELQGDAYSYRIVPFDMANQIQSFVWQILPAEFGDALQEIACPEKPYQHIDLRDVRLTDDDIAYFEPAMIRVRALPKYRRNPSFA